MLEMRGTEPPRDEAFRGFVAARWPSRGDGWRWRLFRPDNSPANEGQMRNAIGATSMEQWEIELLGARNLLEAALRNDRMPLDIYMEEEEARVELKRELRSMEHDVLVRPIRSSNNPSRRGMVGHKLYWIPPDIG